METAIAGIVLVVFLAGVIEGLQEFVLGKYLHGWTMWAVSVAAGVVLALGFGAELYGPLMREIDVQAPNIWFDRVLTGATIGLGSQGVHYVIGWLKSAKKTDQL
ncbi:MAG: hypothetical protein WC551_08225 [Patescibacteria group bacterium]